MKTEAGKNVATTLGKEGKITCLGVLKSFYDEEIFTLLVKEIYAEQMDISVAAIAASGSLGNETAIPHLYQMIERGQEPQRIAAIRALTAVRAPSSAPALIKYFHHFNEQSARAEILRAVNTIAPNNAQVQELNQAVFTDPLMPDELQRISVEGLVESEKFPLLQEALPKAPASVQEAAFEKMLQSGNQEWVDLGRENLSPTAMGMSLCLYALKAKNPQQSIIIEAFQKAPRQILPAFLRSLNRFQGRLRYPTRLFRLLLIVPYVNGETEAMVGDFLRKIIAEVRTNSPHLLSEFSVLATTHMDTVFSKVRKTFLSFQGIGNKELLLATVLAHLLEKHGSPALVAECQAYFRDAEAPSEPPPITQIRAVMEVRGTKEEKNRFEACIPLFASTTRLDRLTVSNTLSKIDMNRPVFMRRLNRLLRVAGTLEIKTSGKKIQEILDFAREEKIHFLEETAIVSLCQLLTRSIIEQSKDYFKEPNKNVRTLNGYIRGARFMPARIMIAPMLHLLLLPDLNPGSRFLVVDTLAAMDLSGMKKALPAFLKALEVKETDPALRERVAELLIRYGDSSVAHHLLDLSGKDEHTTQRLAVRVLQKLSTRGEEVPRDILTNRLYIMLESPDVPVRTNALVCLFALQDDYAMQILGDHIRAGDAPTLIEVLRSIEKKPSRETIALLISMLQVEEGGVQAELRRILPEFCQGEQAEEIRQSLIDALKIRPGASVSTVLPVAPKPEPGSPPESLFSKAKLEFKFRRENTQVLTVLFVDIAGYTEKSSRIDMTALVRLIKAFEDTMIPIVVANRGTVIKKMGDAILAVFKHPLHGVIAALSIQEKVREYGALRVEEERFQVRVGMNTGPVIRKDGDIFGEVVNVASRMETAASPGDILLTEATFEEVRDYVRCTELGKLNVKGIKEAITAYSPQEILIDLDKLTEIGPATGPVNVAKEDELARLRESMFVPSFDLGQAPRENEGLLGKLKDVFTDISRAVEDIATDYHEEYEFKRYLQEKWNEILSGMGIPPAAE